MVKILVFGDSIVWGAWDCESGGFVERLKIHFFNQNSEPFYEVYNLGISFDDTRGLLFRLKKQMEIINKIEPDDYVFVFFIGSNDCRYIGSKENLFISIKEFKKNINEIIELSKTYTNKIIFIGFPIVDESKTTPFEKDFYWENENLKKYNDNLEKICKDRNLPFVPIWEIISHSDLDKDGLHPNAKGHKKIFEKVKEELNKILKVN